MTLGLLQYVLSGRALGHAGQDPGGASTSEDAQQSRKQALLWGTGVRATVMPLNRQKYKGQA